MRKEGDSKAGLDHIDEMERRRISSQPLANGSQSGRNTKGQFVKGCPGGPGNPNAAQVGKNRARLYEIIRTADIELAIKTIVQEGLTNMSSKARRRVLSFLDRRLGVPLETIQKELGIE